MQLPTTIYYLLFTIDYVLLHESPYYILVLHLIYCSVGRHLKCFFWTLDADVGSTSFQLIHDRLQSCVFRTSSLRIPATERDRERDRERQREAERQRQKDRASFSAIRTGMRSFSRIACLMKFIRALLMVLLQFSQFVFG